MKKNRILLLIGLVTVCSLALAASVYAADAKVYRNKYQNTAENYVMNHQENDGRFEEYTGPYCKDPENFTADYGYGKTNIGSQWATSTSNGPVVAGKNTGSMNIRIFSTAYGCLSGAPRASDSRLVDMKVCQAKPVGASLSSYKVLPNGALKLSGSTVKRGNKYNSSGSIGAGKGWTHLMQSTNYVGASIDLGRIPTEDLSSGGSVTYRACVSSIYFSNGARSPYGRYNREFPITIKFTNWDLSINSKNRVKGPNRPDSAFTSYGNFHEGSSPRVVYPGDVVQWKHDITNKGKGPAKFERWREKKGLTGAVYATVGGHETGQTLRGGGVMSVPYDSSNVRYVIKAADIGKTICERYAVQGGSSSSSAARKSTGSCVKVASWTTGSETQMRINNGTPVTGVGSTTPRNARPGDVVEWQHIITNTSKSRTTAPINVWIGKRDTNPTASDNSNKRWSAAQVATGLAPGGKKVYGAFGTTQGASGQYRYTIKPSDAGKTICRYISRDPSHGLDKDSTVQSSYAKCVKVPFDYTLIPNIPNPGTSITPGEKICDGEDTVCPVPQVDNDGPTRTPSGIQWVITRFDLPRGQNRPANARNATHPNTYYGVGHKWSKDGTTSFAEGIRRFTTQIRNEAVDESMPVGSQVCFSISVQPYSDNSSNWSHASICLSVNKTPTVQVWGGDVRANYINTGLSRGNRGSGSALFGSWVEYGAFSAGTNINYASGAALAKGASASNGNVAALHELTFANTGATRGNFGRYVSNADGLTAQLAAAATSTSSNRTFGAGSIGKNTTQIFKVNGTATITGNLTYGGEPYSSIGQIPQRVIIADKIYIRDNVTNIDAWLIAPIIDTCSNAGNGSAAGTMPGASTSFGGSPAAGALVSTRCDQTLRVNGPVIASSLFLKRTGGSESGGSLDERARGAEVFNLRPDAFMWLYNRFGGGGQMWTTGSRDLPPRF